MTSPFDREGVVPGPADDALETQRVVAEAEALLFGTPPAPPRVGRFEVRRRLGAGGVGVVYAAHDPDLDRPVALKLLHPPASIAAPAKELERRRVLREARMLARLTHPNVVTVHEVGEHEGRVFLAMELVAGKTLRAWLASERRPTSERSDSDEETKAARPWREVLDVLREAGAGLAAAHAAGVVHRDFKPENVLIGDDGRVKVGDFGLARAPADASGGERDADPDADADADAVTIAGAGTPAYMAPEQHRGEDATALADQFAFCVVAHEALYGSHPFSGNPRALVSAKAAGRFAPPPRSTRVPGRVWRALSRGLSPRAGDRWPSMSALLAALSDDPARRARRRLVVAVVSAVLGIALLGAVLQLWMFVGWMREARKRLEAPSARPPSTSPADR